MRRIINLLAGLAVMAGFFSSLGGQPAAADGLAAIKAKGEIVIGLKDMAPPFGFRNDNGEMQGFEVDLARDVADRLGVQLKVFAVNATSRLQFLEIGTIDVLIATLAVSDRRQQQVKLVEPYYYSSAAGFLAPPGSEIGSLSDLGTRPVCTIAGAYYNEALLQKPEKSELVYLRSFDEALRALNENRCAAIAMDMTDLMRIKSGRENLAEYRIIATGLGRLPWAVAIHHKDAGGELERILSETVSDWHKTGKIRSLEQQWLGSNTAWVIEQQDASQ